MSLRRFSHCPRRKEFATYLIVVFATVMAAYWTAERAAHQTREGIERIACQDRRDAITGWDGAARVRAAEARSPFVRPDERRRALIAATVYREVAASYRGRTADCR